MTRVMSAVGGLSVLAGWARLEMSQAGADGAVSGVVLLEVSLGKRRTAWERGIGSLEGAVRAKGSSATAVKKVEVCMMK
jgi:hypothetical protein